MSANLTASPVFCVFNHRSKERGASFQRPLARSHVLNPNRSLLLSGVSSVAASHSHEKQRRPRLATELSGWVTSNAPPQGNSLEEGYVLAAFPTFLRLARRRVDEVVQPPHLFAVCLSTGTHYTVQHCGESRESESGLSTRPGPG